MNKRAYQPYYRGEYKDAERIFQERYDRIMAEQNNRLMRRRSLNLSRARQMIDAPRSLRLGWDGYEVRHGNGVSRDLIREKREPKLQNPAMASMENWLNAPSTKMMFAATGRKVSPNNYKSMSPAVRGMWDEASTNAYNEVARSANRRNAQTAESAAYDEILKRLNARGNFDVKTNQERARRLAPLVARNYKRTTDGQLKSVVNDEGKAKLHEFARNLGKVTAPKPQVPKASLAPVVAASTKPSTPAASTKKAASSKQNNQLNKQGEIEMTKKAQEAYARGFCKTAEVYGVDPVELYKYAQTPFGATLKGFGSRFFSRWKQLLGGGNNPTRQFNSNYKKMLADHAKNLENKTGDELAKLEKQYTEKQKKWLERYLTDDIQKEKLKVYGTRAGTGIAGLYGLKKLFGDDRPNYYYS